MVALVLVVLANVQLKDHSATKIVSLRLYEDDYIGERGEEAQPVETQSNHLLTTWT